MGIYDRDYYRPTQPAPGFSMSRPQSVVVILIIVNVAVWLIDELFFGQTLRNYMAVHVVPSDIAAEYARQAPWAYQDTLTHPALWWQFITSGFAHAPELQHILFNMFALFIFGRDVEQRYGTKEFLFFYVAALIFSAVAWSVVNKLGDPTLVSCYGASGAIAGVVILFALNFPHRQLLLFFVIPMPAWVAGVLFVLLDMFGAFGIAADSNVAFSAHLAGAAFAFFYFQLHWNFTRWTEGPFSWLSNVFKSKPRLKVHRPERDEETDMSEEVDRVLAKISREGESSLTAKERRILENASRKYQKRGKNEK